VSDVSVMYRASIRIANRSCHYQYAGCSQSAEYTQVTPDALVSPATSRFSAHRVVHVITKSTSEALRTSNIASHSPIQCRIQRKPYGAHEMDSEAKTPAVCEKRRAARNSQTGSMDCSNRTRRIQRPSDGEKAGWSMGACQVGARR
jgi:hypothetical protein